MYLKPLVSVLIPLYNAEEYLSDTLESIIEQTYKNIEVIIVDDGSLDNSLEIARTYEERYERIKVISQGNQGAASARNSAFSFSSGDYIQYQDADDLLHPDKIRLQIEALSSDGFDPYVMAISRWYRFYKSIDSIKKQELVIYKNYDTPKDILVDAWSNAHYSIVNSWMIPRDLHERTGKWDETISVLDDSVFFASLVVLSKKIVYADKSIAYWRQDNLNSLSKNITREGMRSHLLACDNYVEIVRDHLDYPGIKYALAMEYSKLIYRAYPVYMDLVKEAEMKLKRLGYAEPLPMPTYKFRFFTKLFGFYPTVKLFGFKDKVAKMIKNKGLMQ